MYKTTGMKLVVLALCIGLVGCNYFDSDGISQRKPNAENVMAEEGLGRTANDFFWETFHQGEYEQVDSVIHLLTAAYTEDPNILETVSHLGFAHIWKLAERGRLEEVPPTIIDHASLNLKYFSESYDMNPRDPRMLGFLGTSQMTLGAISDDPKMTRQGYFDGRKSIRQWRTFNYFTVGYVLSQLPHTDQRFQDGLDWMWETMDICYCEKVDREGFDLRDYLAKQAETTDTDLLRACWNSWIAPHNLEGFYLNMGDMLVKSGDWETGILIYEQVKRVPEYDRWPFKDLLEHRIAHAQENVEHFRKEVDRSDNLPDERVLLFNSSISCMSCHQFSEGDQSFYSDFDRMDYFKEVNVYNLR